MKVDALRALELLSPGFSYNSRGVQVWHTRARKVCINVQEVDDRFDRRFRKTVDAFFDADASYPRHGVFDVCEAHRLRRLWTIQRVLVRSHFRWLAAQNFAWQKWPWRKRPMIFKFEGRYIVWNGTHRTWLCLLAGRKMKSGFANLDKWLKEKKRGKRKRKHS